MTLSYAARAHSTLVKIAPKSGEEAASRFDLFRGLSVLHRNNAVHQFAKLVWHFWYENCSRFRQYRQDLSCSHSWKPRNRPSDDIVWSYAAFRDQWKSLFMLNLFRQGVLYSNFAAIEVSVSFSVRYRVEELDQQRILQLLYFTVAGTSMFSVVCYYHNRKVDD